MDASSLDKTYQDYSDPPRRIFCDGCNEYKSQKNFTVRNVNPISGSGYCKKCRPTKSAKKVR